MRHPSPVTRQPPTGAIHGAYRSLMDNLDVKEMDAGKKLAQKAPLINSASLQQNYISGNVLSAPIVAARANPSNKIAIYFNTVKNLPLTVSTSFVAAMAMGSARSLERKVIENEGQAVQQAAKLVWDSVHKMMVKS